MLTDEMRADGWIEHDGNACNKPSGPISAVCLRFRGERRFTKGHGGAWSWNYRSRWCANDIIAYKPETPHD